MPDFSKLFQSVLFSFNLNPKVHFETQVEGEAVILVLRKHPITQVWWVLNAVLLPIVGIIAATVFFGSILSPGELLTFYIFLIAFTFSYAWLNFLLWYFTVGIISNQRVIDLDFYNVLYKEFTASTIEQISEITTKVGGFIGSLFHFGTVFVKTQGFEQNIEFDLVPNPSEIVKILNNLMDPTP